jgi:photosystem II stability/assembly factor-like uncharacterized protein
MLDATHGWANRVQWVSSGTSNAEVAAEAVVVTDDGGAHWRTVTLPAPGSFIGTSDAAHAWVESQKGVYQTADCGATWTRLALPVTYGSVTFLDPDHGFLMGEYAQAAPAGELEESVALWETSDAGARWSAVTRVPPVSGPGPIALPEGCAPVATGWSTLRTGWIVGTCLTSNPQPQMGDAVLLVTHDGGRTWQPQTVPIPPSVTLDLGGPPVFTTPDDGEMIASAASGAPCVYITEDGGATWSPECGALPIGADPVIAEGVSATDGTVVILLRDGTIAESTDGGRSWRTPGPPHPELEGARPLPPELDFSDAEHGFISLPSGALYATSDGGRTLSLVYRSPDLPIPVSSLPSAVPSGQVIVVVPSGGGYYVTSSPDPA